MAKENPRPVGQGAQGNVIARAVRALSGIQPAEMPKKEFIRMKERAEWEAQSRTSKIQVSGRLPQGT